MLKSSKNERNRLEGTKREFEFENFSPDGVPGLKLERHTGTVSEIDPKKCTIAFLRQHTGTNRYQLPTCFVTGRKQMFFAYNTNNFIGTGGS
jgi:hypothetical protein